MRFGTDRVSIRLDRPAKLSVPTLEKILSHEIAYFSGGMTRTNPLSGQAPGADTAKRHSEWQYIKQVTHNA